MSVYQKRHYEDVSFLLRRHRDTQPADALGMIKRGAFTVLAKDFADLFANDNHYFDRNRFLVACGLEEK